MERSQLFDLMGELKLFGMKAAFDEIMATAVKRQRSSGPMPAPSGSRRTGRHKERDSTVRSGAP
jgi:hypothetical protein